MSESAGVEDTFKPALQFSKGEVFYGACSTAPGAWDNLFSNTHDALFLHQRGIPCDPVGHIEPVHMGLAFLGLVHCLCSLASRVSDAAVAVAPAQTVLCTIIFNGTAPIPTATAVNYVPWDVVGFM